MSQVCFCTLFSIAHSSNSLQASLKSLLSLRLSSPGSPLLPCFSSSPRPSSPSPSLLATSVDLAPHSLCRAPVPAASLHNSCKTPPHHFHYHRRLFQGLWKLNKKLCFYIFNVQDKTSPFDEKNTKIGRIACWRTNLYNAVNSCSRVRWGRKENG